LHTIGQKAKIHGLRLTYHPGPFNVLATSNKSVLQNTIKELRQHGEIMDMMELPSSPFAKINIHIGGAYGDRRSALDRWIENFSLLPPTASRRLTIENDDKANMFSVGDLMNVHEATGVPIVFDYHHHQFRTGDLTLREAMLLAFSTWPKSITPIVHYSSSKKKYEDATSSEASHADFVYEKINLYGKEVDIMLEAKAKEVAALQFIQSSLPKNAIVSPQF
jgi:UV DNA damage endonuclease